MEAVGKHYPGHGHVKEDSHVAVPVDNRSFQDIVMSDLIPFERLINAGIAGIMPAHVIFPEIDDKPAGFSGIWLEQILRKQYGFQGAIFSDDISMAGAEMAGGPVARARAALDAGCDMVLVCNDRPGVCEILDTLETGPRPLARVRLMRMYGRASGLSLSGIKESKDWQQAVSRIALLDDTPELELDDDGLQA
jgi:beta-N-acetylhexosaminidase